MVPPDLPVGDLGSRFLELGQLDGDIDPGDFLLDILLVGHVSWCLKFKFFVQTVGLVGLGAL